MPAERDFGGWTWFETQGRADEPVDPELCRAFARCFAGSDGERVLGHLERLVLLRRLPPQASDAELRHLEGQRHAVAYLAAMVARGRA